MRHLSGTLVALSVAAAALAIPTAAYAGSHVNANLVDGTVTTGSTSCSWADAATSADPPDTATVDASTVSISCNDSTGITLNNSPQISFDDAAGTATVDSLDITGAKLGQNCTYQASAIPLTRNGDTREYTGSGITGDLTDGGILCPGSLTLDSATITFH